MPPGMAKAMTFLASAHIGKDVEFISEVGILIVTKM
jgi:hypothetical protein